MSTSIVRPRLALHTLRRPIPSRPRQMQSVRYATSSSNGGSVGLGRAKVVLYGTALSATLYASYLYVTDTRAFVHQYVVPRIIRAAFPDAEDAHHISTQALKTLYQLNMHPRERNTEESTKLVTSVFDTELQNPVGVSAGLDKDGEIEDVLFALGAGVVEIGGITPLAQAGNPKPRVFRVAGIEGMVNRYGLNSRGADDVAMRLRTRLRTFARSLGVTEQQVLDGEANVPPGSLLPGRLLAVQIAKNKETNEKDESAVAQDYVYCVRRLAPYADVLVVNVSSPNTPGLRDLQATEPLTRLLMAVVDEASKTERKARPKVMVKVSPDEDEDTQMEGIVEAVHRSGVDGVIVGNTTKRRDGIVPAGAVLTAKDHKALTETGGYSGPEMYSRTLDLVGRYRKMMDSYAIQSGEAKGQKVLFATGGITNGEQALKVLNAGASVAMVYTGMVYGGAGTITRIKTEMEKEL